MANCAWRLNNRYGVVYIEDRKLADAVMNMSGRQPSSKTAVMATYLSAKGKPFAWQVMFEMDKWERVSQVMGLEVYEKMPVHREEKSAVKGARKASKPKAQCPKRGECKAKKVRVKSRR